MTPEDAKDEEIKDEDKPFRRPLPGDEVVEDDEPLLPFPQDDTPDGEELGDETPTI